jgi:hypothetical protein
MEKGFDHLRCPICGSELIYSKGTHDLCCRNNPYERMSRDHPLREAPASFGTVESAAGRHAGEEGHIYKVWGTGGPAENTEKYVPGKGASPGERVATVPFRRKEDEQGGEVLFEGDLADGQSTGGGIEQGLPVTVIEEPAEGWELVDVICTPAEGMETDVIRGGVVFTCVSPTEEISNCTFVNVSSTASATIPTLSEWGMIAAAAGLGLVGFFAVRRRRAVRA